jgi:hypothetical protein
MEFHTVLTEVKITIIIIRISSGGQSTMGGPPVWGLGEGLTTPNRKKYACYENNHKASDLDGFLG